MGQLNEYLLIKKSPSTNSWRFFDCYLLAGFLLAIFFSTTFFATAFGFDFVTFVEGFPFGDDVFVPVFFRGFLTFTASATTSSFMPNISITPPQGLPHSGMICCDPAGCHVKQTILQTRRSEIAFERWIFYASTASLIYTKNPLTSSIRIMAGFPSK